MKVRGAYRFIVLATTLMLIIPSIPTIGMENVMPRAATDTDPDNDDPNNADVLSSGDYVYGSLLINNNGQDIQDWYMVSVSYKKMLNVSMYMNDWDQNDPGKYNFHLLLYVPVGNQLFLLKSGFTSRNNYRWESLTILQTFTQSPLPLWIRVIVNATSGNPPQVSTQPGHYTLNVMISDPPSIGTGQTTAKLDRRSGSLSEIYYKMTSPPDDEHVLTAMLQCPQFGDFDLYIYNMWPNEQPYPYLWLQNGSWTNASGNVEQCSVGGSEGEYYVYVTAYDGGGTFTLNIDTSQSTIDRDNIMSKAVLVKTNSPIPNYIDQSIDAFDWYKVKMLPNKKVESIYFSLGGSHQNNLYNLTIYDKDGKYITGKYNTQNGGLPDFSQQNFNPLTNGIEIRDISVSYEGHIYIMVRAIMHYRQQGEGNYFIPARAHYKMTFQLPNDPPQLIKKIPDIEMNEDEENDELVLSNYFTDPNGDNLNFTIIGSGGKHTRPTIDPLTTRVTFDPEDNWYGRESITVRATDDGPGNKFTDAYFNVTVNPVNDPPYVIAPVENMTLIEGDTAYTPSMDKIFGDIDDDIEDLTFSYKVLSQDLTPKTAQIPIEIDVIQNRYKIGPVEYMFGSAQIQISASDEKVGSPPAIVIFKVEIQHKNHPPEFTEEVDSDPIELEMKEGEINTDYNVYELFQDKDTEYANDSLGFEISDSDYLKVEIDEKDGTITFNASAFEFLPGVYYEDNIVITAGDTQGANKTLNFTIYIEPINDAPYITSVIPSKFDEPVKEGQSITFKVSVGDNDTDVDLLNYTWYVDDDKQRGQKKYSFTWYIDYELGSEEGEIHTIKVEIDDGTTKIEYEWEVKVLDVNRPPENVQIVSPRNDMKFDKGDPILFNGTATDPDNDVLEYIWTDKGTKRVLGKGSTITVKDLKPGTHIIVLTVTDGKNNVTKEVSIKVVEPPSGGPGFEAMPAIIAVMIACIIIWKRRHSRA